MTRPPVGDPGRPLPTAGDQATDGVQRGLDRVVLLVVLLGFYYNWYRYPFQLNSTTTSPTYADTPMWLSAGKYLILVVVLALAAFWRTLGSTVRLPGPLVLTAYLFLAVVPVAAGVAVERIELMESGIFFAVPLVLFAFAGWRVSGRRLDRLMVWGVYLALAAEAVQVALFLALGRLPALAVKDSFSVRFGSFLDDPNGWGIIGTWLFYFALFRWTGWRRGIMAGGLLLTILLTQSITALAVFTATSLVFAVLLVFSRADTLFRVLVTTLAVLSLGMVVFLVFGREIELAYSVFMSTKSGSIRQHREVFDVLNAVTPLGLLGLHPSETAWGESAYVNALVNLGLLYVVAFLAIGVSSMVRYFRLLRHSGAGRELRAFAAGALALLVAVYVGSLTIPYMEVYPINLFVALLLGLASARLLPEPSCRVGDGGYNPSVGAGAVPQRGRFDPSRFRDREGRARPASPRSPHPG